MAVGVARPNAQGQEITKTAIPIESANSKSAPKINHTIVDKTAIAMTIGTNMPLILSAIFEMGAFEELASSTSLII